MSIQIIKGDLLESDVNYICHQVNCLGKMNSGIAKSIKEKWIKVYMEYLKKHSNFVLDPSVDIHDLLGTIDIIPVNNYQNVINMYSQFSYGYDKKRYTSYDAFWNCINLIKENVPKGSRIGFPFGIASVRGGANWNIIYSMIKEVLDTDFEIYIYKLED